MERLDEIADETLGGFSYEYDALGRIVSRGHSLGGASFARDYSYDDRDRLASAPATSGL